MEHGTWNMEHGTWNMEHGITVSNKVFLQADILVFPNRFSEQSSVKETSRVYTVIAT
jgi:hypothetical protein